MKRIIILILLFTIIGVAWAARKTTMMNEDVSVCNPLQVAAALNDTTLSSAIASTSNPDCSGNNILLITPGTWTIASNLTIPARMMVKIPQGALFSVNSGITLTLPSPAHVIASETQQLYSGSGNIAFTDPGVGWVTPYHFGAVFDGATDDSTTFQSASDAARNVYVPGETAIVKTWKITDNLAHIRLDQKAVLKLPDGFIDATADNRNIIWITGNDVIVDGGGQLDGNKANTGDAAARWNGIQVDGLRAIIKDVQGLNHTRHHVYFRSGSHDGIAENLYQNTSDRMTVRISKADNIRMSKLSAVSSQGVVEFSEGTTNSEARDLYCDTCTYIFQTIIHSATTEAIENILVDGGRCVNCERMFIHQAGATPSTPNYNWTFRELSGTGWTETDDPPILTGSSENLTLENIHIEDWTQSDYFIQINDADHVMIINPQVELSGETNQIFLFKDSDNVKVIGGDITANNSEIFDIQESDAGTHSDFFFHGIDFHNISNQDLVRILETTGSINNIVFSNCGGIDAGNDQTGQVFYVNRRELQGVRDLFTGSASAAGMRLDNTETTQAITAVTTVRIDVNVPSGALILGVQLRVDAALAAGETWDAEWNDGATVQSIATNQAVALDTKVNKFFDPNANSPIADAETDIDITKNAGGAFTAQGTIRAVAYYMVFKTMDNN